MASFQLVLLLIPTAWFKDNSITKGVMTWAKVTSLV